jgi:hypothetical protein
VQVGLDHVDQIASRLCPVGLAVGVDDVGPDVLLEDLGGKAAKSAATCGEKMHHFPARLLFDEGTLEAFDLTTNSSDSVEEFLFVSCRVPHRLIL